MAVRKRTTSHGERHARERIGRRAKLQPPLTPMIDVTFQLLIFFLLTATFREQEGQIPGSLPAKGGIAAGETVQLEPLFVVIKPGGSDRSSCLYEITSSKVAMESADQLYEALMARRRQLKAEEPLIIRPRPNVRWQFVIEAFNQAVRADYKNIGFVASS
jgi:biopolymer transport protein ExbD